MGSQFDGTRILGRLLAILKTIAVVRNWGEVLANAARIRNDHYSWYHCRDGTVIHAWGGEYSFHIVDVLFEIMYQDVYGIRSLPSRTRLALDIGSHVGIATVMVAKSIPGVVVLAFEPVGENYRLLVENIELNGIENAIAFNFGFHSETGSARLAIDNRNPGAYHLEQNGDAGVHVNLLAFDEVLKIIGDEQVDFIKMDCEGAEYTILGSMSQAESHRIQSISLEAHRTTIHEPSELVTLLRERGFKVSVRGRLDAPLAIIQARR